MRFICIILLSVLKFEAKLLLGPYMGSFEYIDENST
jgi:hypothetical protein